MYTYFLGNPPVTFQAGDDKIAFIAGIMMGDGDEECERLQNSKRVIIPCAVETCDNPQAVIAEYIGDLEEFFMAHFEEVIQSIFTASGENEEIMQRVKAFKEEYPKWLESGGRSLLTLPR